MKNVIFLYQSNSNFDVGEIKKEFEKSKIEMEITSDLKIKENSLYLIFWSKISYDLKYVENIIDRITENIKNRIIIILHPSFAISNNIVWKLIKRGASFVFKWSSSLPKDINYLLKRWETIDNIIESPLVKNNLIGRSQLWLQFLREVTEIALFTKDNILLIGESGTGKEQIAKYIHTIATSVNKDNFVIVDCTTIVPELSGSELFGHEKGAFTGAISSREGAFELANGGTLFLDEIGELPLHLQTQLLRVVQEHTYKKVGGNTWQTTEFRLICATNKNLLEEVEKGRFRLDLYYRISNWVLSLPPLEQRKEDIIPLAEYFIRQKVGNHQLKIDENVKEFLLRRKYKGNIRELKILIERLVTKHIGESPISAGDIPMEEILEEDKEEIINVDDWERLYLKPAIKSALYLNKSLKEIRQLVEDILINSVISEENGNLQKAARRLGITDRALQIRKAKERHNIVC